MIRLGLARLGTHVNLLIRGDALLWSINERLAGREGMDVPPPDSGWLEDIITLTEAEQQEAEEEEAHRRSSPDWDVEGEGAYNA